MPLEYPVHLPSGHHWARLTADCPQHPEEAVAGWATFDGETVLIGGTDASDEEYVGWMPSDEQRAELESSPLAGLWGLAVTEPDVPEDHHRRLHIRCPRPSCSYDAILRSEQMAPIKRMVQAMWVAYVPAVHVPNIEDWLQQQQGRGPRNS